MQKKVLVTGISGYVGQHCAAELLKQGYRVKGSLRDTSKGAEVREGISSVVDPKDQLEFCALDLTRDAGWEAAMEGCDFVLHVASPFLFKQTKDENEIIKPAVEGTLRALKFAQKAKVKRVVLTSSIAAMSSHMYSGEFNPGDWTDLSHKNISTYARSKTLAEKAAWDFYNQQEGMKLGLSLGIFMYLPLFLIFYGTRDTRPLAAWMTNAAFHIFQFGIFGIVVAHISGTPASASSSGK